jgi:uncharacterized protein YgfB (UPF0149 family)
VSDLERQAQNASSILPAAELHGLVCGFAAGNPAEFSLSDFVQLVGTDALTDEAAIGEFVGGVLDVLYSPDMDFMPVIPDDSAVLGLRLEALAQFTAGFLSGFGAAFSSASYDPESMTSKVTRDDLPLEVQEILHDFASISGLDEEAEGDEQDEVSFMELFEYVRVASVLALTLMPQTDEKEAADDGSDAQDHE